MFRLIFFLFTVIFSLDAHSQDVVSWDFSYNEEKGEFVATANIENGWHLYSQNVDEFAGPIPTAFVFEKTSDIKFIGDVKEPKALSTFDSNFDSEVAYFDHEVSFTQRIKIINKTQIKGYVTYMVCNDTMCLPPVDEEFTISINKQ